MYLDFLFLGHKEFKLIYVSVTSIECAIWHCYINIFIPKHKHIYIYIYEHTRTLWMYNLEKERVPEQDRAATRVHLHLRS